MTGSNSQPSNKSVNWPICDSDICDVFAELLANGGWGRYHGPYCDQLKHDLAAFHSVDHVHLCSSGTCAVELALRAADVQPGDEVILAAYDFKANFTNVIALGAKPVLVDTLAGEPVLDPSQLSSALTDKTKAIICSHLHGHFALMSSVSEFADAHKLVVIEDACQVPGGEVSGQVAGSLGHLGTLSFGGSKLLTAGRGGAVLTNDSSLAQRIRLTTQRGNDAYPLSEMQAAVLIPQLKRLKLRNQQRLAAVQQIIEGLNANSIVSPTRNYCDSSGEIPVFYKVPFLMSQHLVEDRDQFVQSAQDNGVALFRAFQALHLIHAKSRFHAIGELKNAADLHERLLTLHHPVLLSDDPSHVTRFINAYRPTIEH